MKPALVYVLSAVVFIGVFYAWMSDDIEELRNAHISHFNEGIKDENNLANFLSQHPEEIGKSVEELMQKNRENVERNISVQTWIMGGSLALTMVAAAYSVLAVFFWRAFVRKW
jgi:predicted PurR-regulated permease PerM